VKKYLVLLACILFISNGCTKTVYVHTKPPKLQEWVVSPLDVNVTYEVYDENG